MSDTIYDADRDDFATQLVGKSIKTIAGDVIELTDGTTLEVQNTGDCCAWFRGEVEAIDLTDNAITAVERVENGEDNDDYGDENYSIHILSAHKLIAKVNIEGNATSGYYCHSINLNVKAGK